MIRYIENANFFESAADGLVNPVNSRGVMGKGLALEFSRRFPEILAPYKAACSSGDLRPGALIYVHLDVRMGSNQTYLIPGNVQRKRGLAVVAEATPITQLTLADTPGLTQRKRRPAIILFPTKVHWRFGSRLDWIHQGLECLKENYQQWGLKSIAMPQLGCGLGGLRWEDVRPVIEQCFLNEPLELEVYLTAIIAYNETTRDYVDKYPSRPF